VSAGIGAESAGGASSSVNLFVVGGAAVGALVVLGVAVAVVLNKRRTSRMAPQYLVNNNTPRSSRASERRVEIDAGVVVRDQAVTVNIDSDEFDA
jgi:hypothetical protein